MRPSCPCLNCPSCAVQQAKQRSTPWSCRNMHKRMAHQRQRSEARSIATAACRTVLRVLKPAATSIQSLLPAHPSLVFEGRPNNRLPNERKPLFSRRPSIKECAGEACCNYNLAPSRNIHQAHARKACHRSPVARGTRLGDRGASPRVPASPRRSPTPPTRCG